MAVEEIVINLNEDVVEVLDVQENFIIQDIETAFTIEQVEENFTIEQVEETINVDIVDEVITVTPLEQILQFDLQEAIVIQKNYYTEEEMPLARRVDFENDETYIYKGEAAPGSVDTDVAWRIHRIILNAENDATYQWAAGNANFDKKWSDHLSLVYI